MRPERFVEFLGSLVKSSFSVEVIVVVEVHDEGFVLRIAGLDERSAAAFTCARFSRMLPLLSITRPIVTGTSCCVKTEIFCSILSSKTRKLSWSKVGNEFALVVGHRRVQHHHIDALLDVVAAGRFAFPWPEAAAEE